MYHGVNEDIKECGQRESAGVCYSFVRCTIVNSSHKILNIGEGSVAKTTHDRVSVSWFREFYWYVLSSCSKFFFFRRRP